MAANTQLSLLAVLSGLALASACTSDSSGPGNLPSCGAQGTPVSLAVAAYVSIDPATDSGCVTFAANTGADTAEYLVLPWSAGGTPGSHAPFALESALPVATIAMSRVAPARPSTRGTTALAFDNFLRALGRSRRYPALHGSVPVGAPMVPRLSQAATPPTVGSKRTFKVCSNLRCSPLVDVGAVARAVGAHIAIYIDTLAPSPGLSASDLDSLKTVFDSRLYPLDTVTFGHVSDIDSNTVVIVLMSNRVNRLVTAADCNATGGAYVAGFFFPRDLAPGGVSTNYNNGEIFYSIVADPAGTLSCAHTVAEVNRVTPVTFTHEFQHMINFVEHVLVKNGDSEDGWLDEGLSKYAEEIAARSFLADGDTASFSNYAFGAVYDAYQYLLAPGGTPLLIPDDTGTLAMVGASWLFTRYIVDQFGDSLPGRLVRTPLFGAANVTAQTGQPFPQTVSRWALANWVSDLPGFTAPSELKYTSWHFRRTFGALNTGDPTDFPLAYPLVPILAAGNAVNVTGNLWSGSGVSVRAIQRPGGGAFTLRFSNGSGTVVPAAMVPRLNIIRIR